MCGIAGVYTFNENGHDYKSKIDEAISVMGSRGPDNQGKFLKENVALGHVRLSIIDVSEAASQPFTDSSGRYTIIFNGEIYNFQELKRKLEGKGIAWKSQSDTEVILYLYIHFGEAFLNELNGFFAIAIYDNHEKSLFIARDRMGIKPLWIYSDKDKFLFASELKGMMALGIPKVIDKISLNNYLQQNYIAGPASIFENVSKMVPGTYLKIKGKDIQKTEYYSIPTPNSTLDSHSNSHSHSHSHSHSTSNSNYEQSKQKLYSLMDDSVRNRMISDVPLGAFLSGGVDSSVIVALASKYTNQLKTFSIGFKDEAFYDETSYAEIVANKFKTNHTVFKLSNPDLFEILFDVLDYIDEPFADSSALPVYMLSRLTKQHVTVALSGDGADEMFGGYNKHRAEYKLRNLKFPSHLLQFASPILKHLPQSRANAFMNKARQLYRFAEGTKLNASDRYWRWCSFIDENEAKSMIKSSFNQEEYLRRKQEAIGEIKGKNLNDILYADMKQVLQNDMLVKVDMMSMANSLEVRVPFLDHNLVDFVFSLPSSYKIDKYSSKKILKDTFVNELPSDIANRGKHGFEVPLLKWFQGELKQYICNDLLNEELIREQNIFNYVEIEKLKQKLFSINPGDVHARIWGLIVFQHWWKKYLS